MRKALHSLILMLALSSVANSITAGPNFSRLISITNTLYIAPSFGPVDSTHYYYTGTAQSYMKTGVILYDSAIKYNYAASKYNIYSKDQQIIDFTTYSLIIKRGYTWVDSSKTWHQQSMIQHFRDSTKLDTLIISVSDPVGVIWHTQYKYINTYDGNKNLIQQLVMKYDTTTSGFDSLSYSKYTYDASNNMLAAYNYTWSALTVGFLPIDEYAYYYTAGKMTMYQHLHWNMITSGYAPDLIANITYDGSGRQLTVSNVEADPVTHVIGPYSKDSSTYDASGNLIAFTDLLYNKTTMGYDNNTQLAWTYNTYNQPLIYASLTWDGAAYSPLSGQDTKTFYQYEVTNDVKEINNGLVNLQIFPLPAKTFLHVNLEWDQAKPFTIALFDQLGRLVLQNSYEATLKFDGNLPVQGLVSGNYVLVIGNGNEKISRQIVVNR